MPYHTKGVYGKDAQPGREDGLLGKNRIRFNPLIPSKGNSLQVG